MATVMTPQLRQTRGLTRLVAEPLWGTDRKDEPWDRAGEAASAARQAPARRSPP
jgi:hypothetical protein